MKGPFCLQHRVGKEYQVVFCFVLFCVTNIYVTSRFTDCKVFLGNQQLLMQLINNKEVNVEALNDLSSKELTEILKKVGVESKDQKK